MRLYLNFFSVHLRSAMQHKASFFMSAFGQFIVSFTGFLGIYYLFARFRSIGGYSYGEVLLCASVILLSFSTAECFARGFDTFSSMISNGQFDRVLVRPRSAIFLVLCSKMEFSRIGRFLQGVVMLVIAVPESGIEWTAARVFVLVLMTACGSVMFAALFLLYAALCFFTTEGLEFMNIFTDGMREFGRYPLDVYGKKLLMFFTAVIPVACIQYWPLLYLYGRSDSLLCALAPLCALIFTLPCYALWRAGLKRYRSTGS